MSKLISIIKTGFFTHHRVTVGIVFLVVLAWCVLNFFKGDPFFAVLALVFFIISIFLPKPSFMLVLVLMSFYIIRYSPSIASIRAVQRSNNSAFSQPGKKLSELFSPNSGLFILPDQVELILSVVQRYEIPDFQISANLQENKRLVQRIVESVWPIRVNETSKFAFITPAESANFTACEVLETGEEVILVLCH